MYIYKYTYICLVPYRARIAAESAIHELKYIGREIRIVSDKQLFVTNNYSCIVRDMRIVSSSHHCCVSWDMLTLSAGRGRVTISQLTLHLSSHCLLAHTASQRNGAANAGCSRVMIAQRNQDCVIHRLVIYNTQYTQSPCTLQDTKAL